MSTTSSSNSRYPIPATSPEKERLAKQYAVKKAMYGWSTALPDDSDLIDLSAVHRVIDVGAGTCVWAFDLLSMPRRPEDMQLYVCDINTSFFPEKAILAEFGITAFQQDVTKPFPEELRGTFDLVHASFLVGGLDADGWRAALANYHALLKPGGLVLLDETDLIYFPEQFLLDPSAFDDDLNKHLTSPTWIHKSNCIFTGYALQKGLVVRITQELPTLLASAGFAVLRSQHVVQALGPLCQSVGGGAQAEFESFSIQNVLGVMKPLAENMLKRGALEVPPGRAVEGEDEVRVLLEEIETGVRTEGAVAPAGWFLARKE
ncbi:S-adenosyl-L-methionine-dependent methyltransferase [Roridomyces roridus]|uniref:S-adenosyl-L-methionine-dependent methyltransferase n=1 Tax=Roridomyces roridus TaxID=1738132 RepID=A0AAD7FD88_9AGAR|nr:S-adenosyl-L-methionine-dependent methyltransferase [Roridomyces roridus]